MKRTLIESGHNTEVARLETGGEVLVVYFDEEQTYFTAYMPFGGATRIAGLLDLRDDRNGPVNYVHISDESYPDASEIEGCEGDSEEWGDEARTAYEIAYIKRAQEIAMTAEAPDTPKHLSWRVYETSGGVLTLVVIDVVKIDDGSTISAHNSISYIHEGYEMPGATLIDDLWELRRGADPAEQWDGNLSDSDGWKELGFESLDEYFSVFYKGQPGASIVADNDGIYWDRMDDSAMKEFGK
jgi:hypothetical protein